MLASCTRGVGAKLELRRHGGSISRSLARRLETRRHGGIISRSLAHKLEKRRHGGVATGGRCGGVSPRTREGRNGPTVQRQ